MGGCEQGLTNDHYLTMISTWERFCHIIRNFVDYLLDLRMFLCTSLHAFERAVYPEKLRVKGRISPE
jgi:hypothetical protein